MRGLKWTLSIGVLSLACVAAGCKSENKTPDTRAANTPPATDADNTARNAGNEGLPTPGSHAETAADLAISAAIRQAVVGESSLSVNAHNVKIMTTDGVVTLRGPVKSEQEKTMIESKAKQVPGVTRVENFLEVEQTP